MIPYTYAEIEDAIKARISDQVDYLGAGHVRSIPPNMDASALDQTILSAAPLALVSLEGWTSPPSEDSRQKDGGVIWHEDYLWVVLLVAKSFRSLDKQIRGDSIVKGAYDLIEDVSEALQDYTVLDGMWPCRVMGASIVGQRPGSIIYRIDITCGQDRGTR